MLTVYHTIYPFIAQCDKTPIVYRSLHQWRQITSDNFLFLACYYTIAWYQEQKLSDLLFMAGSIGLGMIILSLIAMIYIVPTVVCGTIYIGIFLQRLWDTFHQERHNHTQKTMCELLFGLMVLLGLGFVLTSIWMYFHIQ